jgi:hypothetical protein
VLSLNTPIHVQLLDYITSEFKVIKRKQAALLGLSKNATAAEQLEGDNKLEPAPPRPPRPRL